jgi:hypothetical protein
MATPRERLGKHVPAESDTHATVGELLETVFSTRSVPRGVTTGTVWSNEFSSQLIDRL